LKDGDVVIAAISSCTHTSNPQQMMTAALLARNARRQGLAPKPWVKTSLSPGSRVVEDYFRSTGLQADLDALGFHITGFGCMTCAGNPGALAPEVSAQIREAGLTVCSIVSGNRNFEGRTHPDVRASYLGSPALVIAYALAGTILTDLTSDPLGFAPDGTAIRLADIWPGEEEVAALLATHLKRDSYERVYAPETLAPPLWQDLAAPDGKQFAWQESSTHVRRPPFFEEPENRARLADIAGGRPLAVLGDNITTDHISPFGRILPGSAAARHLSAHGVAEEDWSSYAEHRGNHEVLLRGTFSNPRIRNALAQGQTGSLTTGPNGEVQSIMAAAEAYQASGTPTVVFAGKAYGTGSARDWAAKGTFLIGVRAVVAESFERIHRANLVGVGVVPCQLPPGVTVESLGVTADTTVAIEGLSGLNGPRATARLVLKRPDGSTRMVPVTCRIDTETEVSQFREGGLFASAEEAARALSN
jgi:aconitate hydratase